MPLINDGSRIIVAISGAADLGKSFLAKQLVDEINRKGQSAAHLPLDSYLMDRTFRIRKRISGYQPEAYNLSMVERDLKQFKKGQIIKYYPYDHMLGKKVANKVVIYPCSILFLDGLHSMNERLNLYVDFSIFIYTDDNQLKLIRHEADIAKRSQSVEFSKAQTKSEFEKYKHFVEPYRNQAEFHLLLKKKWDYQIIDGA